MFISEIPAGQAITFVVTAGDQQLEFLSTVLEAVPRKRMILADAIIKDGKALSLRSKGIQVHMVVAFQDQKPLLFQNVEIHTYKKTDGAYFYTVACASEGKEYNRRGAFRCYVGVGSSVRVLSNSATVNITIKDVSSTGFSFTTGAQDIEIGNGEMVHTILNDYIEETAKNYSFPMTGIVVRSYILENGYHVFGCKLNDSLSGLEKYIAEKERVRLARNRTSLTSFKERQAKK